MRKISVRLERLGKNGQLGKMMTFEQKLKGNARLVDAQLRKVLTPGEHFGPPKQLASAMQYAVLGGGKRFRPFLLIETAKLFGVQPTQTLNAACALECIHCYSLAHDDLPAMDNDDLRRGQPTLHKAFDEATAILAGDALLTIAFEILSDQKTHADPQIRIRLVTECASSAGWAGMVGGQVLDLQEEGKGKKTRLGVIQRIHTMKTAMLIEAACACGAIIAGPGRKAEDHIRTFGRVLGLAFQASDDVLDATGATATLGKTAGKDAQAEKATIVARMGLEKAQNYVRELEAAALEALEPFGEPADSLRDAVRFVTRRKH